MKDTKVKPADVRKQIASGNTTPLYLLEGEDVQSRHDLALEFAAVVDEGLQAFNVESFYANEATTAGARDQLIGTLLSTARTLPMMAPRRVLIVHEADRLLSPRKGRDEEPDPPAESPAREKRARALTPIEELEAYFETPEPLTTLVFVAGPLDGNRRLVKLLRKHAIAVECGTLESEAEAARWIRQRLEKDALAIDSSALSLLLAGTGLALGRVRAEVDKLALYAAGQRTITARHVRELVTASSEPSEGLAVGFAVKDGDTRRALREIGALFDAGVMAPPILGQIRWGASYLRPDSRLEQAMELILQTDLAIKSSAGEPRFLLERLVIELCAGGGSPRPAWRREHEWRAGPSRPPGRG